MCTGCDRAFVSKSAWVLHLEQDTCPSNWNLEMTNEAAARCYQALKYIASHYRDMLLQGETNYSGTPFYCNECQQDFRYLSALVQHAESRYCSMSTRNGPLERVLHFLRNEVARYAWSTQESKQVRKFDPYKRRPSVVIRAIRSALSAPWDPDRLESVFWYGDNFSSGCFFDQLLAFDQKICYAIKLQLW